MCCEYSKLIDHGLDKIFVPMFAIQNSSETARHIDFEFLGKLVFYIYNVKTTFSGSTSYLCNWPNTSRICVQICLYKTGL